VGDVGEGEDKIDLPFAPIQLLIRFQFHATIGPNDSPSPLQP